MEHAPFSSFGVLLHAQRIRRGLSQQALATALGIHRNTIGNWERGEGLPQSKGVVLELARQVHLDDAQTRQLLEASLTALAPAWTVPFLRNSYCTAREALLQTLQSLLAAEGLGAPTGSYALSGLGGSAKPKWLSSMLTATPWSAVPFSGSGQKAARMCSPVTGLSLRYLVCLSARKRI